MFIEVLILTVPQYHRYASFDTRGSINVHRGTNTYSSTVPQICIFDTRGSINVHIGSNTYSSTVPQICIFLYKREYECS